MPSLLALSLAATAALTPLPATSLVASSPLAPWQAAALSVGGGVAGIGLCVGSLSPASPVPLPLAGTAFAMLPTAGHLALGAWPRALLIPVGHVLAGGLGYVLGQAILSPLAGAGGPSSASGSYWTDTGLLLGMACWQGLVAWDAWRLAAKAPVAP